MSGPTPDKVMQLVTGGWAASVMGAAARHGLCTALEGNPETAEGVAKKTGISLRGAQALLDGLTGLGILTLADGKYQNTPEASAFLVKGKPGYLGALAEVFLEDFATWQKLPEAAKTGQPTAAQHDRHRGQSVLARARHRDCAALVSGRADGGRTARPRHGGARRVARRRRRVRRLVGGVAWRKQAGHRLPVGLAECERDRARIRGEVRRR